MIRESVISFIRTMHRERVFHLALVVIGGILVAAVFFTLLEPVRPPEPPQYGTSIWDRFGRAIWWAFATVTTVGYGDVTPSTPWGRVVGIFLMVGGLISLSVVTATVASIYVEKKFRRERGLEAIKTSQHILILGWPEDAQGFLDQLFKRLPVSVPVALVNREPPEQLDILGDKYPKHAIFYLRGDYSREEILLKANVLGAIKAIILADRQPGETAVQADQRTLFTALSLKALHPKIRILAELLRPENRSYLERAGAEEVLIRGQYDSSLLAGAIASPGIYRILTTLLIGDTQNLWSVEVPPRFHGRPVGELTAYLKESHQALLVAVYTEGRALSLEDLLAEEPTAIDDFIRRKFAETKMTHLLGRTKVDYQVNPPSDQLLGPRQFAVVIAVQRPSL